MAKPRQSAAANVEIYGLFCAATGELRYIGKANDSKKRFLSHLRDTKRRNTPVYKWLAKCVASGQLPSVKVLTTTTQENWEACERGIIAFHRESGANLLNVADGGAMPYQTIEDRRQSAKRMNAKVQAKTENQKEISRIKRIFGMTLARARKTKDLATEQHVLAVMRRVYTGAPHICPEWANV